MKIAAFGHYPIHRPLHGGQRRVAAIAAEARRAGHAFRYVPVYSTRGYPDGSPDERLTAVPEPLLDRLHDLRRREDLHLAQLIEGHPLARHLLDDLRRYAPDVVQFEQPWLYPLFARALASDPVLSRARIVYSAHNVESALIDPCWQATARALEGELVARADLVIAVSAADAAIFDEWRGAGRARTLVAPNGCWPPAPGEDPAPLAGPYALVAGSAHPPNATGYWTSFGEIPGFLPPGSKLAVAGGMTHLITADDRFRRYERMNAEFVAPLGVVEESCLAALLHHARAICLPITEGGGTNLKTAEALMWRKPVVAMRPALRGFEEAEAMEGVYVADTPEEFRNLLRDVMTGVRRATRRAEEVARYGWHARLSPLIASYGSSLQ
ncbi:glycosyltransferase [Thioclava atlantica]|uniref:Glycosyltransferase n=1 Tax=Thioclava atlantica TaxID=1317124 RepID=A0A085TXH7_9RHOB|nr:glycosyltransferase [Thioclava atlantica]KFE35424.1 glycosyltransferase [Thioclava atlantica]